MADPGEWIEETQRLHALKKFTVHTKTDDSDLNLNLNNNNPLSLSNGNGTKDSKSFAKSKSLISKINQYLNYGKS